VTIRRAYAAFAAAVIIGCVLMPMMTVKALAVEPGIPGVSGSEALEEFENRSYKYDNFWGEPYAGSILSKQHACEPLPGFISKDDSLYDVDVLFRVLKYGYAGYQSFGGDEVLLTGRAWDPTNS
jgi:hypothetical protein